nr:BhlA/UviB family holin-like peptide [Anaerophilus nitritogenes]
MLLSSFISSSNPKLIFYILKTQEKRDVRQEEREKKYQEIILNLTDKLNLVEDVKKDVEDIKNYVFHRKDP